MTYIVKISYKKKVQFNTLEIKEGVSNSRVIEIFKNLYKATNDSRRRFKYEVVEVVA